MGVKFMKYFVSDVDTNGFVYSIDNCIFQYDLKYNSLKDDLIAYLYDLQSYHQLSDEFWTRLNLKPSSHWSWCSDICHLCNGIYLSIGKYNYLKDVKEPLWLPVVRLEVNLNKHSDKPVLSDLLQWLKDHSGSCTLIKYDVAVDVPKCLDDVQIFGSRQERGLYKGTRYFGQRNKHGYTKIYDKKKEQGLESDLTRVETTLVYKNGFRLNDIYVRGNKENDFKLNDTDRCFLAMLETLKALGEDQEQFLDMLGRRKKERIKDLLGEFSFEVVKQDENIIKGLLERVRLLVPFTDPIKPYFEDSEGFLRVDENYKLPFE